MYVNLTIKNILYSIINTLLNFLYLIKMLKGESNILITVVLVFVAIYIDVRLSNLYCDKIIDFKTFLKNMDKGVGVGASLLYMSIMFVIMILVGLLSKQNFSYEVFCYIGYILYSLFRYWLLKDYLKKEKLGLIVYFIYMLSFAMILIAYVLMENKMYVLSTIMLVFQVFVYIFSIKKITLTKDKSQTQG